MSDDLGAEPLEHLPPPEAHRAAASRLYAYGLDVNEGVVCGWSILALDLFERMREMDAKAIPHLRVKEKFNSARIQAGWERPTSAENRKELSVLVRQTEQQMEETCLYCGSTSTVQKWTDGPMTIACEGCFELLHKTWLRRRAFPDRPAGSSPNPGDRR